MYEISIEVLFLFSSADERTFFMVSTPCGSFMLSSIIPRISTLGI